MENQPDLSIVAARKNQPDLSIVAGSENQPDLSIVARVRIIEQRRRRHGIRTNQLVAEAKIYRETWRHGKKTPQTLRSSTVTRLEDALDYLIERQPLPQRILSSLGLGTLRAVMALLAMELGDDVATVLRQDFSVERPRNAEWLRAAHLRRYAMAIIAIDLDVGNAALARGIGCSRQNLKQARDFCEAACDADPALQAAIDKVTALVTGRGN